MLLNDNEYSLQTISERTNISIENLEKIANREWSKFKRAHVLGLISIIEREFKVDLSDLKEEAKAYYNEHKEKELNRPIDLVDAASVSGGGSRFINNLITVISILAVAYAGWFYFVKDKEKVVIEDNSSYDSNSGMFEKTIKDTKEILTKESNSTKVLNSVDSNKSSEENISKIEVKEENLTATKDKNSTSTDTNSNKKFDITEINSSADNNEKNSTKEIVVVESNQSQDKNKSIEDNGSKVETAKQDNRDELGSTTEESNNEAANDNSVNSDVDINVDTTTENSNNEDSTITEEDISKNKIENATIKLHSKRLWMGIYYAKSGKRESKFIKKPLDLMVGDDTLIVVTGHNKFEVDTQEGVTKFNKKGKVYFEISKDGIKELSKREYKKLTHNRAW